jgi:uncharacterized protein
MGQPPDVDALLAEPASPETGKGLMGWFSSIKGRVARGDMMLGGLSMKEVAKVPDALRKAAACGVSSARLELATWLANPPVGAPDLVAADEILRAAVQDQLPNAALQLVRLRWFARRADATADEKREADELLRTIASAHPQNGDAMYLLGLLTCQGFGTDASPAEAFAWQQKAAALGHTDAQFELFLHHATALGTTEDTKAALQWLRRAAEANHPRATYNLGAFYATGRYVEKDSKKAVEWYTRSANAGNANATATLAVMYAQGEGVTKDLERAEELFDEAEYLGLDVTDLREGVGL